MIDIDRLYDQWSFNKNNASNNFFLGRDSNGPVGFQPGPKTTQNIHWLVKNGIAIVDDDNPQ
jgi:hypothetical protein